MPIIEGARQRNAASTTAAPLADDASYGPFTSPGVPAAGYLNGIAAKGAQVVNTATGVWYSNTGTQAATAWTVIGAQV